MTKDQQVSFESIAIQIAHEKDESSVGPQFVHVPHLRAIDENFLFACNATVGLEGPSVPQVAHPVDSPRVQDVSMGPASWHRGQAGAQHADQNRTHRLWECGRSCHYKEKDKLPTTMQALIFLLLGTNDVGRGRNLLVGRSVEFFELQKTCIPLGRQIHTIMSSHRVFKRL